MIGMLLGGGALLPAAATSIPDPAMYTAEALRTRAMQDDMAYAVTRSLTTEIGPRLAGSPNDARARAWAIRTMQQAGFDRVYTEPVDYPRWERHSESGAIVAPYPQPLVLTALGYSAGTPAGGLTAEVVQLPDLAALRSVDPARIRGKIVFVDYSMPRTISGSGYGPGALLREQGPVLAAAKGAAAFLLRSVGTDHNRLAHTGVTGFSDPSQAIPAAALASPDADMLERELASGHAVTVQLKLDVGFNGIYHGANVIGEIRGRLHPEQIVAIGGHLDSWDPGTGAIDDGAGIGITVAAAKLIAGLPQRPDRTIRVIAFANEEAGEWGGQAYARRHAGEIGHFQLGVESDLGADRIFQMRASVKPQALPAIQQIAHALAPLGVAYAAMPPGDGGSDLSRLHAVGMAALSLDQDTRRYFDWHHTANDTLDKIDLEPLRQNVAVYAIVAYLAAEADGDFGSAPGAFAGGQQGR
ncbi:M28 family peptidase [Frateuria aurantia]